MAGIKLIEACSHRKATQEFGVSRGGLMPQHRILGDGDVAPECASDCRRAWCLFTGDGAERGPILEMVTEKYLLRSARSGRRGSRR